jgi:hypothetical protein
VRSELVTLLQAADIERCERRAVTVQARTTNEGGRGVRGIIHVTSTRDNGEISASTPASAPLTSSRVTTN